MYDRQPERTDALLNRSDYGSQYVSIRYSERLTEAGIEPSVGSGATAMTTLWPKRFTACTKLNLFAAVRHGKPRSRWNSPRWNGCTGLTTTGCLSLLDLFHLPKLNKTSIGNLPVKPPQQSDLSQRAAMKPGAIHTDMHSPKH